VANENKTQAMSRAFNMLRGMVAPGKNAELSRTFNVIRGLVSPKLVSPKTKKKTGGKITKKKK
tara:strand:- start:1527 stop:1715 length:189 start_codon:yes stop_codon:yes gene_type:complete